MRSPVLLSCLIVVWAAFAGHALAFRDPDACGADESQPDAPLLYTPDDLDDASAAESPPLSACQLANEELPASLAAPPHSEPASPDTAAQARVNLERAEHFIHAGKREDALLALRAIERDMPRIADRFALRRAELALELDMPQQACDAYALASESPNREIAIQAQIGSVRCLLRANSKKSERALQALLTRYPRLPQRHQLEFELAQAREVSGSPRAAAELYRKIDLATPASSVAARARAALESLRQRGVRIAPYTGKERVQRAERLLFDGPFEQASAEVESLQHDRTLGAELRGQVTALAAKIARIQGRFAEEPRASDSDAEREAAERRIKALRAGRSIARLNNAQLRSVFELAVAHGMKDTCDETIDAMRGRKRLDASVRYDAAIKAAGLASEDKLADLLAPLLEVPRYRLAARYYRARALERSGHGAEAEAEYQRVIALDHTSTAYYAMWADLRLWNLRSQSRESCLPHDTGELAGNRAPLEPPPELPQGAQAKDASASASAKRPELEPLAVMDPAFSLVGAAFESAQNGGLLRVRADGDEGQAFAEPGQLALAREAGVPGMPGGRMPRYAPLEPPKSALRERALALLAPIAAEHGEAYPWLLRAEDLIEVELFQDAADEINEAYLAFRDVTGALRLRSGLLALLTGSAPPRRAVSYAVARARRALDRDERARLADIANLLGDPGVGVRFGRERIEERPRAYAELVESAAKQNGIDPNLLFAVMRVESIYNRRIISNAGAVGLMQIMPATGQRIANKLGRDDFDASELLDPKLNLEFSAWYLASLIQRFDGRLPLAIASYNGGPHNVRLWMRSNPPTMPLDAFLERIPFSQTHDYVRRVLSYYAQYRAQQNLPMTRLSVELPKLRPDTMAF